MTSRGPESAAAGGVLAVEWDLPVVRVTLNRPDKLNALSVEVLEGIIDLVRELDRRRDARVVLLRGAGRMFSAGADLAEIDTLYRDPVLSRRYLTTLRDAALGLEHLRQPVIAAVHGMVLAGGLELMLACDLVIAAASTRIGDQHMNWGFIAGGGSTQRLPRWIGPSRARDLLYTGRWMDAHEAQQAGLVARVVPDDELDEAATAFVQDLAGRSPDALARTKALVRHAMQLPLEQGLDLEIETVMAYYAQPEFTQGIEGFKSRTPPVFP
jgi:enoyl-CoA hydratase/carnithine racemase